MNTHQQTNRLAVDIGGTFTDVVVETGGAQYAAKVLTTAEAPEKGVIEGITALLGEIGLSPGDLGLMVHGTTLATNAIIERKGAITALITTDGFRDVLDIADEGRYDQYDIYLDKPRPLVPRHLRFTVPERVSIDGRVLKPLDEPALEALLPRILEHRVQSVAVGFIHGYRMSGHEQQALNILRKLAPQLTVTLASEVCPEIREYERLTTATANAYVQPLMTSYLNRLGNELETLGLGCPLLLMTSGGGLTTLETAARFPIRLVESGPAAGAILAGHVAEQNGLREVLSFDMGGTTAKICLLENGRGQTARAFEVDRAARFIKGSGLPLRIPVIEMVEIGAGGGSCARVNGMNQIEVGPESAGSEPGPVCYGRDGETPAVTDADLALGRIDADNFAGGSITLDTQAANAALAAQIGAPLALSAEMAAFGISEIVDETMANAARVHAVERGKVVAGHTLIAFGGAAPLHASRLAEKLSISTVLIPQNAGVGSAVGLLRAPIAYEVVRSRYLKLKDFDPKMVNQLFSELREEAHEVVSAAAPPEAISETRLLYMRYVGQGHEIAVPIPNHDLSHDGSALIQEAFNKVYRAQYERTIPDAQVEVLTWALTLSADNKTSIRDETVPVHEEKHAVAGLGLRDVFNPEGDEPLRVPVFDRDSLEPGDVFQGPCIVVEKDTSTYVSPVFVGMLDQRGTIVLKRSEADG